MHSCLQINERTWWVGANDRETDLFEALWPLPRGISYNSYLLLDEKTALIDTVKEDYFDVHLAKLQSLLDGRRLDYLIINHMEPDHSGSVPLLCRAFPGVRILGAAKATEYLGLLYRITDNVQTVKDTQELNLGETMLRFYSTPMVHWPETMMTYEQRDGILFSGDAFGTFAALEGGLFDDETDVEHLDDEILRYFANIVGRYSRMVQKALAKLKGFDIRTVAPAHGPVWRKNPAAIIDRYDRWSRYEAEEGIVIAYASMYANTTEMMEAVARGTAAEGVSAVRIHDIARTHVSYVIRDAWRYKGLVLGSPTYDTKLFPPMDCLVRFLDQKMLRNRVLGVFGTYGWSGGAVKALAEFANREYFDLVGPAVEARFSPTAEDLEKCFQLGRNVAKRLGDGGGRM